MLKWISRIYSKFRNSEHRLYAILKPCFRCVYGKRYEPILIVSLHRGPRILVNFKGHTYIRKGKCIGLNKCLLCVKGKIDNTPCKWILMK